MGRVELTEKRRSRKPAPQFKNVHDPEWNEYVKEEQREREEEERKRIEAAKKAIRDAYWRNWDSLPSVWIARDDDDSLWMYNAKPVKAGGMFHCGATGEMMSIDNSCYPDITYENSPIKVKLMFIDA